MTALNAHQLPDQDQAQRFLDALCGEQVFTFQTYSDAGTKPDPHARVLHGGLAQYFDQLCELNKHGAGIFVMVNRGDGVRHDGRSCRTTASVKKVRALFVDLDGAPLEPLLDAEPAPDIIVQSSPQRYHGYWTNVDCPLEEFRNAQRALAQRFDGDPSVTDLPRVMRVPGFFHLKGKPFMTRILVP